MDIEQIREARRQERLEQEERDRAALAYQKAHPISDAERKALKASLGDLLAE